MAAKNKPNELYLTRMYDAPVKMVWDSWTDPEKAAKWWGPRGFTITTHSKDFKPGGHWSYTMHGPDGVNYENTTKYLEVEKYSRMVYDHGGHEDRPPLFRVTVEFKDIKGKTKMDMTMALATEEAAKEAKKFIKQAGGDSTWDRLAEYLSPVDRFVINRSFDVSQELLFDVWTDPERLSKWLPPKGFTCKFIEVDIKPGGTGFYVMSGGEGMKIYGKTHYIEVRRRDRLVYTQNFCDENGKMSRHAMSPTWPETMLTTVTFDAEATNRTRVTIEWEVYGDATAEERATFHAAKAGMTQGWTGSFDKLEEYLESGSKKS